MIRTIVADKSSELPRVVIAGGGITGLEALIALHEMAGERIALTLIAPGPDFIYRPLHVAEPFTNEPAEQRALPPIAEQLGAEFVEAAVDSVDPAAHQLELEDGSRLDYDCAVICVGARNKAAFSQGVTFTSGRDLAHLDPVLSNLASADGPARIAFVVPPGNSWPLPIYELALMTRRRAQERGFEDIEMCIYTPEEAPLIVFGTLAAEAVGKLLAGRGISVRAGVRVGETEDGGLELRPGGERIEDAAVLALPVLEGPAISGLPADSGGFIPIDDHARVKGAEDLYAAGDGTNFPIKQGGIGTQQADAAAEQIASRFGAEVDPQPFHPVLRGMLLTGDESLSLSHSLTGGEGEGSVSPDYLWWPPQKVSGRFLAPWLSGTGGYAELAPPGRPLEVEIALPPQWHSEGFDLDPYAPPEGN